jgi:creatinine amidohydrolase
MRWEHLTSAEFAQAVRDTGVCLLAMGVVEKHGDHLPLGTDYLNGHQIACLAAEREPAVVFPPFYFGQIYEARCFPGTITLKPVLLLELIQGVLDEIGRNGFKKIIIVNAHGGNTHLLSLVAQCTLWEERPYSLYLFTGTLSEERQKAWQAICKTSLHAHACECETSISLANHPELVKMERVPATPAEPLGRLRGLPANFSGISWYADYPEHYAGDARPASAEKGYALRQLMVEALAEFIAAVKADQVVPALNREFFARSRAVTGSPAGG